MAVPTREDAAPVEYRHAPPAADGGADEPVARTAEVARRAHDAYGIVLIFPLSVGPPSNSMIAARSSNSSHTDSDSSKCDGEVLPLLPIDPSNFSQRAGGGTAIT